jgi:hypothetical protein
MKAIDISESIFWTHEKVAAIGQKIYDEGIKAIVETPENIGKMLTLDVETGEYRIGVNSIEGGLELKHKNPVARLFTLKIGYDVAVCFDGTSGRSER